MGLLGWGRMSAKIAHAGKALCLIFIGIIIATVWWAHYPRVITDAAAILKDYQFLVAIAAAFIAYKGSQRTADTSAKTARDLAKDSRDQKDAERIATRDTARKLILHNILMSRGQATIYVQYTKRLLEIYNELGNFDPDAIYCHNYYRNLANLTPCNALPADRNVVRDADLGDEAMAAIIAADSTNAIFLQHAAAITNRNAPLSPEDLAEALEIATAEAHRLEFHLEHAQECFPAGRTMDGHLKRIVSRGERNTKEIMAALQQTLRGPKV